jgi:hypothetical protein
MRIWLPVAPAVKVIKLRFWEVESARAVYEMVFWSQWSEVVALLKQLLTAGTDEVAPWVDAVTTAL